MRKILFVVLAVAVLAPAALAAEPAAPKSASAFCKAQQTSMKAADFKAAYKTFGQCVAKKNAEAKAAQTNAAKSCKADQENAAWRSTDGKADKGNGNGNAYGKCVSSRASEKTAAQQTAEVKAAKTCKTLRAQGKSSDPAKTWAQAYGSAKNAYGKCVSSTARALQS